ncbi:hypothetical protein M1105_01940 [Limibaculum sp. FT325]|uniref:hypothetical protein n=1 Tax=Thermohalobaculum sediminis TaxID=2939436 RepID=UPI0020BE79B7|nr:hypothetical protein [Limibaculum sediminis]MCL5775759.1 hypothetical protein [Limibaculum sediminis]
MFGGGLEHRLRKELAQREHFSLLMPMPEPVAAPDAREFRDHLRTVVAHAGATVELHPLMRGNAPEPRGGALGRLIGARAPEVPAGDLFFVVSGVALWIAFRDTPIGDVEEVGRFVNPEAWPGGREALAGHRAHVEICDLGMVGRERMTPEDAAFNRAVAVTAAAAAVVRGAMPLALLWLPARGALAPAAFRDQLARVLAGHAPLELWMRWFFVRPEDGERPGVITRGLAPFIGREIEVRPSIRPESEALALAFATASLLIDRRGSVADGQLVTPVPGLSARVRLGESRVRRGLKVIELTVPAPLRTG